MSFDDLSKSLNLTAEAVQSIPEELRNDKSLEPIKDLPGTLKTLIEGQKMIGGSLRIPKDDAKPEEITEFENKVLTRLGRPEKPEEYKYTLPNQEFLPWEPERVKEIVSELHQAGATNKVIQRILDVHGKHMAADIESRKTGRTEAINALKSEWGSATDRNVALARRVVDIYGGEELKNFFRDDPLGNAPHLVRALAKMGDDLAELGYLGGPGDNAGATPDDAASKIRAIQSDPNDLYHAKFAGKPGHKERVEEVEKLYAIAYNKI